MNAQLALPLARATDPDTSRAAAQSVRPANALIIDYIRRVLRDGEPLSHEQIAERVSHMWPHRWTQSTIVTACARAGLHAVGTTQNSRGRTVTTWAVTSSPCPVDGVAVNAVTSLADSSPGSTRVLSHGVRAVELGGSWL